MRLLPMLGLACSLVVLLWTPATRADAGVAYRWTGATPDETIELSVRGALAAQPDALARLVLIASLADEATRYKSQVALQRAATALSGRALAEDRALGLQARWLAAMLRVGDPEVSTPGLLRRFALVGPFHDAGGGLMRREGPERVDHDFARSDYSWGANHVRARETLPESATALGLPLGLYVSPRRESCTYLFSAVTAPAGPLTVHVANAGSLRASWDGVDVLTDPTSHRALVVDRGAIHVPDAGGEHLLQLKICNGAQPDTGRVRVHFTDARGAALKVVASSDLGTLQRLWKRTRGGQAGQARSADTPLGRVLEVGEGNDTDAVLGAAVVRTLGQADDAQSPRAPGLLDRVVASARPDQLAMAGYVAPFVANQSGWLEQARRLASETGDDATAVFAARALVEVRLGAGHVELARATLAAAPLLGRGDAHRRWLAARTTARIGSGAIAYSALDALTSIVRDEGESTPLGVWRSIARLSERARPELHLRAAQILERGNGYEGSRQVVAALRLRGVNAVRDHVRRRARSQSSNRSLVVAGETLLGAGAFRDARDVFALAHQLSPNRVAPILGLLRARSAIDPDDPVVGMLLARARELRPDDAGLAAEAQLRQDNAEQGAGHEDDERFIAPASELLARAKASPAPAGVFARSLHWRRVVRFHPDKRVSQLVHYAREIVIEPRSEGERYERLPFTGRHTELLFARVHRVDGSVHDPDQQDASGPAIRWPKLQRGDVVEVALRTWSPGPVGRRGDPPFYFIDYVGAVATHPVLYNEVIIDAPPDSPLSFDVVNGRPDRKLESTHEGRRVTRLIWDAPPSVADEPFAPRASETLPLVVGSIYRDWDAFLAWYRSAVAGFTVPDDQVRHLAAELTEGLTTREEKLSALFNFVADDIRYVNFVSGEWWLPNRPQHLLARRQGDCDDKAMLLISLLDVVGIEAKQMLLQTRQSAQPTVFSSSIAVPLFDHGIVYLPDGSSGRFLDATSPQQRLGALPSMDAGAPALIVDKVSGGIQTIPGAAAADNSVNARWRLELDSDGGARLEADELHVGDSAFYLRTNLKQPDARAQWIERHLLNQWISSVTMDSKVSFEPELEGAAARVSYRATSRAFARREGRELVVSLAPVSSLTAQLAPLRRRTLPVVLPPGLAPRQHELSVELVAPAGYRFAEPPPDRAEGAATAGSSSVRYERSRDRRRMSIKRRITFTTARINTTAYEAWRVWLQRTDAMFANGVRLRPE